MAGVVCDGGSEARSAHGERGKYIRWEFRVDIYSRKNMHTGFEYAATHFYSNDKMTYTRPATWRDIRVLCEYQQCLSKIVEQAVQFGRGVGVSLRVDTSTTSKMKQTCRRNSTGLAEMK